MNYNNSDLIQVGCDMGGNFICVMGRDKTEAL